MKRTLLYLAAALVISFNLFLLFGCGSEASQPTPPGKEYVKVVVPVPTTNDIGATCPAGFLATSVFMRFYQNGAPKQLELECVK